jgi:integrase
MTPPASADIDPAGPPRDLAALLAFIETTPCCDPRVARECACAIRSVGKWRGKPLDRLPTDPASLRRHLAALRPQSFGVSPQRFANVRSLVLKALVLAGVRPANRPAAEILSPDWARLFERLGPDDRYLRTSLLPFARFCCAAGSSPDRVSDAIAGRYLDHLEQTALIKAPRTVHQTMCRAWNQAGGRIAGWPVISLAVPRYAATYSLELDEFPSSFRDELECYLARLACDEPADLLDERAPSRPLKPSSVRTKRYQVRVFASALVHQGVPIENITSLAVLTTPENFKLALQYVLNRPREDESNTKSAGAIAHTIRSIAKYHAGVPAADLGSLDNITARLNRRQPGMIDRNRARLAQFDDEAALQRFLDMPPVEIDRLRRKGIATRNDAVDFSKLLALEILLHAPLRISNLMGLRVGDSLLLPAGNRRGESTISIGRRNVKNRRQLHFVLPEHVTDLIVLYLQRVRPLLDQSDSDLLFPNGRGGQKRADTMSKQLSALVRNTLGIDFNPHLARHLAAKLYIDARPGDYEGPRRLLGHRRLQTTYDHYEGLETRSASALHAELIRTKRRYIPLSERPRAGRRLRAEVPPPPKRRR